jgi:hypothetical protein
LRVKIDGFNEDRFSEQNGENATRDIIVVFFDFLRGSPAPRSPRRYDCILFLINLPQLQEKISLIDSGVYRSQRSENDFQRIGWDQNEKLLSTTTGNVKSIEQSKKLDNKYER